MQGSTFAEPWGAIASWLRDQEELAAANGAAGTRPIQMIMGPTVDAAAAGRSLAEILNRRGRALFNQTPLHSYKELASTVAGFQESGEGNCFLLVGCGGDIDLTASNLFDFTISQVHVIHNVRPFHLNNLRSTDLHVWDRQEIEDSVNTFFNLHAPNVKKRDRGGHSDDEDEDVVLTGRHGARVDWRQPDSLIHLQDVQKAYYSTNGMGRGVAETLFTLAVDHLQFTDNLYLWNSAVGLADLYLRNLLERSEYDHRLQTVELALQTNQAMTSRTAGIFGTDSTNALLGANNMPFGVKPPPPQLVKSEEHRPTLLRHWTLWNSLWHDPVIAAKLGAHNRQTGEINLRDLLAKVGVHVENEAKKPWANLETHRRETILRELLPLLGDLIGTEHALTLPCICRNKGHPETSTFDLVRLFTALVSAPMELERGSGGQQEAPPPTTAQYQQLLIIHRRRQFWAGYELIWDKESSRREGTPFLHAVSMATSLHKTVSDATDAILSTGTKGVLSFPTSIQVGLTDGVHQAILGDSMRLQALGAHVLAAEAEMTRAKDHGKSSKYRTPKGRPLFLRCQVPDVRGVMDDTFAGEEATASSYFVVYFNSKHFGKTEPIKAIKELQSAMSQYNATYSKPVDPEHPELGVVPVVEQQELGNRHVVVVKGDDVAQRFTEQVYLNLQKLRHV